MKKITPLKSLALLITLFCAVNFGFGQIVAWEMLGNSGNEASVNATTLAGNLNMSALSRGSGLTGDAQNDAFSSLNYTSSGTQANAITNNDYLQFQVSATSGFQVSLSTLDATFRRSNTGPNTFIWRYSTDGVNFTDIGSTISYTAVAGQGDAQTQINLSTIPSLQNVVSGTTITIRLYGWGADGGTGSFAIGKPAGNDLSVGGTVSAVSCTGLTTMWDGASWDNGVPTNSNPAVINGSYNTATNGGSFSACSLTINSSGTSPEFTLTVGNGDFVEVENDVVVNGNLIVETQGNFVQNDDLGTFTVNAGGLARVNKTTAEKADWFYYTYWSSPVEDETIGSVFPDVDGDRRFWFNAANFEDTDGDDIDDDGNDWQYALAGDTMLPGTGYAVTESRFFIPPPGPGGASGTATFEGPFNTGDTPSGISYNAANFAESWNFIGNPYPSAIDFIAFHTANSSVVEGVAYFWSQATPPAESNPGNEQSNFSISDYAMYTVGTGGVDGGSGEIPNQYIPSGQGFFISGLTNGTVTFTNAMRMADGTSNDKFFKNSNSKKSNSISNKLWINLSSDNGVFNQILVGYVEGATNNYDGSSYDAKRLLATDFPATLYSTIENLDKKLAIQGKDINSLTVDEVINLGFATNINVATLYKLSIAQIEGDFLSNNPIYIKDNLLNELHDLSASDYTFTSEVGEFNDRFEIVFNSAALSTTDVALNSKSLRIIELEDDRVQFTASDNLRIKSVNIFDLLGRQLYSFKGNTASETYTLSNLSSSIYIAKVELSNGAVVTKKGIKK